MCTHNESFFQCSANSTHSPDPQAAAVETRKYSRRMHTVNLQIICASVATTRCARGGGGGGGGGWVGGDGRQVNMFEQVSSVGHHMSLAEGVQI